MFTSFISSELHGTPRAFFQRSSSRYLQCNFPVDFLFWLVQSIRGGVSKQIMWIFSFKWMNIVWAQKYLKYCNRVIERKVEEAETWDRV